MRPDDLPDGIRPRRRWCWPMAPARARRVRSWSVRARHGAARTSTRRRSTSPTSPRGGKCRTGRPVLEQAWREALDAATADVRGPAIVIGGKSMGGRMASHIAAQGCDGVDGLVFLGYPLHPPGKPEQRRDAHLPSIARARCCSSRARRDAFGTSAEIAALLPSLQHAELHDVAGRRSLVQGPRHARATCSKGSWTPWRRGFWLGADRSVTSFAPCAHGAPPPPRPSGTSSATPSFLAISTSAP